MHLKTGSSSFLDGMDSAHEMNLESSAEQGSLGSQQNSS